MKTLCLIILEDFSPSEILQKLKDFDFSNLQVSILALSHQKETLESQGHWQNDEKIHFHILPYPDDEFYLKDLLQYSQKELLCFFNPSLDYPTDYFQRTINRTTEDDNDQPVKRRGSLMERILKAAQQSKYGLGVLKKDIQRDYSDLQFSKIYSKSDFKSGNILEQSVDEELPNEVFQWADKYKISATIYHPNYQKIEYYQDLDAYVSGVRKDAPYLKYKEKEDASGLPLYLLIMLWLSLVSAFIFPAGILIFLVFLAIYSLVISLEALAISTLKRQGELFIGLLFFLPFLHHIYLFSYFSSLITAKKSD